MKHVAHGKLGMFIAEVFGYKAQHHRTRRELGLLSLAHLLYAWPIPILLVKPK